jgi:hypothetical protein
MASLVHRCLEARRWNGRADHLARASNPQLLIGLSILIAFDLSFIALYLLDQMYGLATDSRWDIESDHSCAEIFGYLKLTTVFALLIATFGRSREQPYLIWAGLFAYVLLDDTFLLHQRLRDAFDAHSHSTSGQVAAWILVGMLVLAMTAGVVARSSGDDRTNSVLLLTALAALGFFAVAVDLVHAIFHSWFRGGDQLLTVLEEGGEQLVQSLTVAIALLIWRSKRQEASLPVR